MPEAVELVFLPGLVGPPQLAALAVADGAGQGVAPLTAAEQVVDGPPVGRVVGVFEHVQGLDHPAELGQGMGEAGRAGAALQRAQDRRGDDSTGPQRGGEPADLVPVAGDEPGVDAVTRQPVQRPVVGLAVDAPQPLVGQVGQPRCPPVAQRPGQGKDDLGGAGGVSGDHLGLDAGLVGQQPVEDVKAVALGSRYQLLGEHGVGVGHPRILRGAALPAEVAGVVGGVDGGPGRHGLARPHSSRW